MLHNVLLYLIVTVNIKIKLFGLFYFQTLIKDILPDCKVGPHEGTSLQFLIPCIMQSGPQLSNFQSLEEKIT